MKKIKSKGTVYFNSDMMAITLLCGECGEKLLAWRDEDNFTDIYVEKCECSG